MSLLDSLQPSGFLGHSATTFQVPRTWFSRLWLTWLASVEPIETIEKLKNAKRACKQLLKLPKSDNIWKNIHIEIWPIYIYCTLYICTSVSYKKKIDMYIVCTLDSVGQTAAMHFTFHKLWGNINKWTPHKHNLY